MSSTGGGDGDIINYNGAAAWGKFWGDPQKVGGLNFKEVTKSATGIFKVVFETAMPDANYSVVASPISGPNFTAVPTNLTADGFDVEDV